MFKHLRPIYFAIVAWILGAQVSLAIEGTSGQTIEIKNPLGNIDTIQEFVNKLLELVIQIGTPILVLAIVYTGFLFVKARGNSGDLEKAKASLWWTVIGAAIVLGAFVISSAIQATINNLGL